MFSLMLHNFSVDQHVICKVLVSNAFLWAAQLVIYMAYPYVHYNSAYNHSIPMPTGSMSCK